MADDLSVLSSDFDAKIAVNPRAALYKKPIRRDNYKLEVYDEDSPQEVRRQRLLNEQKKNRDAAFNAGRGILEEALICEEENGDVMDVVIETRSRPRREARFRNQLMMSEWMLEVPQDLTEKWLMVPCPQGRRALVIACKGVTRAYNKRGIRLGKFSSSLPGGSSQEHKSSCTILDCIWEKETRTYFALDVLAWSNQPLLNCDTEFRFFWMQTRLEETQGLKERGSPFNSFPILPLPSVSCGPKLSEFLSDLPALPPLDGLLFYHREALYTRGRTPLVTWLKPFMLPEVLGVSVPPPLDEKPDGYIDFKHHIESNRSKGRKNKASEDSMETANIEV